MNSSFWKYMFSGRQKFFSVPFTLVSLLIYVFAFRDVFSGELAYYTGGYSFLILFVTTLLLAYYIGNYIYWLKNVKQK